MEKVLIVSTGKSKSFHKKGVEIEVTSEMAEILVNKGAAEFADGKRSTENPYSKLKIDELRSLCSERGVEFTDEKKAELIELLLEDDNNDNNEE